MSRCECMFKDEAYCKCFSQPSNASRKATEALGRLLEVDLVHSHPSPTKMAVGSLWELYNGGQLEILANTGIGKFPIIGRFRTPQRMEWRQGLWDMGGQFQNHSSAKNEHNIRRRWTDWKTPKGFSWHVHRRTDNLQEWWSCFPREDGKTEFSQTTHSIKLTPTPTIYPKQFKNKETGKWEVLNETSPKANEIVTAPLSGEGWAWQSQSSLMTMLADDSESAYFAPPERAFRITWKEKQ